MTKTSVQIFGMKQCLMYLHQSCSHYASSVKVGAARGVIDFSFMYIVKS
jgi:hypothetical protein